jgi:hypothetical protein
VEICDVQYGGLRLWDEFSIRSEGGPIQALVQEYANDNQSFGFISSSNNSGVVVTLAVAIG